MKQSFLKVNNSKTEIVIFRTWNQHNKITTTSIDVGDTSVNISLELTYLDLLLNQSFDNEITHSYQGQESIISSLQDKKNYQISKSGS